jgi:hypothetical protein
MRTPRTDLLFESLALPVVINQSANQPPLRTGRITWNLGEIRRALQ